MSIGRDKARVRRAMIEDMRDDLEPIEFLASIAPTDGGLKAHGLEGFRMLLDIPESETPAYVRLLLCRGQVLKVTVSIVDQQPAKKREPKRKREAKRVPEWGEDGEDEEHDTR